MKKVDYDIKLSTEDRLRVYFEQERGEVIKFILNYSAKIHVRKRTIMRSDTCHGYPHKHTYHLQGREVILRLGNYLNNNNVFTEMRQYLIKDFQQIKENFLFTD